jgi:thiamine biosynthesis lipoprotein ApbE
LGGPRRVPSQAEITQALASVGADKMRFDPLRKTIRFTDAHTRIDLGGIAKGYGVDLVAGGLRRAGTMDALIDLSGNMVALGNAAGKDGWTVGVRDPSGERPYLGTIRLHDEAISTSGNYEQFVDVAGKRYGHIIDPRTGWPAQGLVSVTVAAALLCATRGTRAFSYWSEKACRREAHDEFAVVVDAASGGFVVWIEESLRFRIESGTKAPSRCVASGRETAGHSSLFSLA